MTGTKIVVNGQTIELKSDGIPVRYITQRDFDLLTDQEKEGRLFVVDDGTEDHSIFNFSTTSIDGSPVGSVISFMGKEAPKDYLICDGTAYKILDYPDLAAFFLKQFGSATYFGSDGDGTFKVPDLRNMFLRGYHGSSEKLSGEVGKKQEGTQHPYLVSTDNNFVINNTSGTRNTDTVVERSPQKNLIPLNPTEEEDRPKTFTSRPVNVAVLYCIKAVDSIQYQNDYSEEERRIGTWIDGKPLYRRIIKTTSPDITTDVSATVAPPIENLNELVTFRWTVCNPGNFYVSSTAVTASMKAVQIAMFYHVILGWKCWVGTDEYKKCPLTIICEYTKTTD